MELPSISVVAIWANLVYGVSVCQVMAAPIYWYCWYIVWSFCACLGGIFGAAILVVAIQKISDYFAQPNAPVGHSGNQGDSDTNKDVEPIDDVPSTNSEIETHLKQT